MFGTFFDAIFNMLQGFSKTITYIVDFLKTPLKLGFDLPVIGFLGISLASPIAIIGGVGILALIIFWFIKAIVPLL